VGQRARNRDALLFAAGQLRRIVMAAIGKTHFVEQLPGASRRIAPAGDFHRNKYVLERRQRRNEMEELKHEPDLLAPQLCECILPEPRNVHIVEEDLTAGRRVEARDEAKQRGLAAARWTKHCEELP